MKRCTPVILQLGYLRQGFLDSGILSVPSQFFGQPSLDPCNSDSTEERIYCQPRRP